MSGESTHTASKRKQLALCINYWNFIFVQDYLMLVIEQFSGKRTTKQLKIQDKIHENNTT